MPHEGWIKNGSSFAQKWMKIATPVIGCLLALPFVKIPRVLFLPQVRHVWGNLFIEAPC
jgi:hypothetical protein